MVIEKEVSADELRWAHAFCGSVKIHPGDKDIMSYVNSDTPITSEPNGQGIDLVLVGYSRPTYTTHFRRKDALSSEYLSEVRRTIHNRVISVVSKYIKKHGITGLNAVCKPDMSDFPYADCKVEQKHQIGDITYIPDIVVYQENKNLPRVELEVVFTHDIEKDRRSLLEKHGHSLLSINIEAWVNDLAQYSKTNVSDGEILGFVKTKKFNYYTKAERDRSVKTWRELNLLKRIDSYEPDFSKSVFAIEYEITTKINTLYRVIKRHYSDAINDEAFRLIKKLKTYKKQIADELRIAKREKREREERERKERAEREERERKERAEREERERKERAEREEREERERKERVEREDHERKERIKQKQKNAELLKKKKEAAKIKWKNTLTYVLDVECYSNFWMVLFKEVGSDKTHAFELYDGCDLNRPALTHLMCNNLTVGFNSNSYDLFMIAAALNGFDNERLKRLSDEIITSGRPGWMIASKRDCEPPNNAYGRPLWNHIDIINVAPGQASLKIYGGRLNAPKMQDLPISPDAMISSEQREELRTYCLNDLETTELLYNTLSQQMSLRYDMSIEYGTDLRSKSDAQIAEAVFRKEIGALENRQVRPLRNINMDKTYRYLDPKIISFHREDLKRLLTRLTEEEFPLANTGSIKLPDWLRDTKIEIGETQYQMGIGGLHSCEKKRHLISQDDMILRDADVASYYPSIILQQGLIPENIGKGFVDVYSDIYHTRLAAKASGDKVTAGSLKIALNGSFGKLGSKYSALYAPDLLIQTTITGQLSLLMLIERLEAEGIPVVSANTDGIVAFFHKDLERRYDEVCWEWMLETSYELEFTNYKALYSRDVNSYIAVKPDGSVKGKGAFAAPNLMKNPQFVIVNEALYAYLSKGTALESTINACSDVTKFLMVRNVTGGAVWNDQYLGKAVRFYYSNELGGDDCIRYAKNGNKVPMSDGAKPMMQLSNKVPADIDRQRYIHMAKECLKEFGLDP